LRTLRLCVRLVAAVLCSAVLWSVCVVGQPVARVFGRRRVWQARMAQIWARCFVLILGMRVQVEGEPPTGAFLLVSNHLSYVDVMLLASRVRAAFVAKSEIRGWPVLGALAASGGTLFVDRGRNRDLVRVSEQIQQTLDRGLGVILFPEGTSTPGSEVAAFRSSLLEPAARLELPVRYASIHYQTPEGEPLASEAVSWWGGMTLGPHVLELLRMPGFEARLVFGEESICDSDRKTLAAKLHTAVSERFVPMPRAHASSP